MFHKIYILGAPGAGVSSLGKAFAARVSCPFFDTDDYYWFTDDPEPYRRKRNPEHRLRMLRQDLEGLDQFVLSGALLGWGESLADHFDAIVYRWLPTDIRLSRIAGREAQRYGAARIGQGGDLSLVFQKFMKWASDYDERVGNLRSRQAELAWIQTRTCPVLRLEADSPIEVLVDQVFQFAKSYPPENA